MIRPSLAELEQRCQKPDHRQIGNWMARRIARPAALRITWLIVPAGISAHTVTLLAWCVGGAAAALFAMGTPGVWLSGAVCLQIWYLLDHVDGQLARWHGTSSLDGVQLDYLMHHTLNLLIPLGVGYGVARASQNDTCLATGLAWGLAALLCGMLHDARYKAFIQRLKRVRGNLVVRGGGGARPTRPAAMPRHPLRCAAWVVQKLLEPHVAMNLITFVACATWLIQDQRLLLGKWLLVAMAATNGVGAAAKLWKSQRNHAAETEFAAWFAPPRGATLDFHDGWWHVDQNQPAEREPTI